MPRAASTFTLLAATFALLAAASGTLVGAQTVAAPGVFVSMNPPTFTVTDHEPAVVKIKLLEKPAAGVTASVFLEADGVLFDKCRLQFTEADYQTEQAVTIYPKAAFAEGKEHTSIFGARLAWKDNEKSHKKVQSVTFKRNVLKGRICQSVGDPHYTTFDNKRYDFYRDCTTKAYYLLKSDTLVVQSRHGPWTSDHRNAITAAVAIAFGSTVYVADARKTGAARITRVSPKDSGIQVIKDANFNDIQFITADGAQVKLTAHGNGQFGHYFDVNVVVPACYLSRTSGLCGTYDNNANNDFTMQTGGATADAKAFGESWEVAANDVIFDKNMGAGFLAALKPHVDTYSCTFPDNFDTFGITPVPAGYDTQAVAQNDYVAGPLPPPPQAAAADNSRGDVPFKDFVTKLCTEIVKVEGLDKIPQLPADLINSNILNCVEDCQLGGSIDPVDSYRVAVFRGAHTVANNALEKFRICAATGKPRPRTTVEIEAFSQSVGFGHFKCVAGAKINAANEYTTAEDKPACSGHGECMTFGCQCSLGWAGKDCQIDVNARKAQIPPKPAVHIGYT